MRFCTIRQMKGGNRVEGSRIKIKEEEEELPD